MAYTTKRTAVMSATTLCNAFKMRFPSRFSIQSRKAPAAMVAVPYVFLAKLLDKHHFIYLMTRKS